MELPSTPPSPARTGRYPVSFLLAVLALGAYAAFLAGHMAAVPGGADSSGYFNHARMLASGTVHDAVRELPGLPSASAPAYLYVPLGLQPARNGNGLVPLYPAGFPLFIAAARILVGWEHSAGLVLIVHAVFGLVLTWLLARALGLPSSWATVAAAILAASPLYLSFSIQAMSDLPALVWTTAAVLTAWLARKRSVWSLGAGAAFAMAVLIRPTDALALAPVAIALGRPSGAEPASFRRWAWFVAGGLPGAVFFCLHSRAAYGHFLATGYGIVGPEFRRKWVMVTLGHYAYWLPVLFTPVIAGSLGLPWVARSAPRAAALLGSWMIAFVGLYSAYSYSHENWGYLRFLLPAAPALVIGGLLVLRQAIPGAALQAPMPLALPLALAAVGINGYDWTTELGVFNIEHQEEIYPQTTAWLRANLPPDAVILCMQMSGSIYFDSEFTVLRWDQINPGSYSTVATALKASGRPLFAALFSFETKDVLKARMPGRWTQVGAIDYATVWRRDGD